MNVYFAHPVSDYGSTWELDALYAIASRYPCAEIVNPNQPDFEAGYGEHGMSFFIERCNKCDVCVFAAFPDGNVGAGVGSEAFSFIMRGAPVLQIDRDTLAIEPAIPGPVLTVESTRKWIKYYGECTQKTKAASN